MMDGIHQVCMCKKCKKIYSIRKVLSGEEEIIENKLCFICDEEIRQRVKDFNRQQDIMKKRKGKE
jgi:hypothetical protein